MEKKLDICVEMGGETYILYYPSYVIFKRVRGMIGLYLARWWL